MKLYKIIDKQTKLFIRDDFNFDEETEIGLDVTPAQGLYKPKWDGDKWVEGATQEEIDELTKHQQQEPTVEELMQEGFERILKAIEEIKNPPELDESSVIDE